MSKKSHVYLLHCKGSNFYKIGSSNSPEKRLSWCQSGCPYPLILIFKSFPLDDVFSIENALHKRFWKKRIQGEWFRLRKGDVNEIIDLFDFAKESVVLK